MSKVNYSELRMQSYFYNPAIKPNVAKKLFKFRVHMTSCFGNNFRGSRGEVPCSRCENHIESQEAIIECQLFDQIDKVAKYKEVYESEVTPEVADLIETIVNTKKMSKEEQAM